MTLLTSSDLMLKNEPSSQYLELYKLAVEMADRVSSRRAIANSFFLTVNTALLGFISIGRESLSLVALGGITISATWWALIKSYRDLNEAKFDVITRMEERLEVRVFGDEWRKLKEDRPKGWQGRYAEFNVIERFVPIVFSVLYVMVFIEPI